MIEYFLEQTAPFDQTRKAADILGKRVIAKSGLVVGKVSQIRLDGNQRELQGVLVRRMPWQSKLYISTDYIHRLTPKAIILDIDPLVVLRGRSVVSKDGKKYGRVSNIKREEDTNKLVSLVVRRRLFFKREIPASELKSIGSAIILQGVYANVKDKFNPSK
jgi:sporulation protein YlmC with PRC-barrel domain